MSADGRAASAPLAPVALAAMGVVFGDIGTSPLYTMKEVFGGPHGVPVTPDNKEFFSVKKDNLNKITIKKLEY